MSGSRIRRRTFAGTFVSLLATALIGVMSPAQAGAQTGDLSYVGCIGNLPGCGPTNPARRWTAHELSQSRQMANTFTRLEVTG